MNAELRAAAAAIPIPVDHTGRARAYCTTERGGYRVWFAVDGGRQRQVVGPTFPKQQPAYDLADLLNGDPTPRSAPDLIPSNAFRESGPLPVVALSSGQESSEAPVPPQPAVVPDDRTCVNCGGPIPPGSRSHRRTCSPACRVAHARAVARPADSGTEVVTLSGPSAAETDQLDLPLPAH